QRNQVRDFIGTAFEEHTAAPWVVSTYAWLDSSAFVSVTDHVKDYATGIRADRDEVLDPYAEHFFEKILRPHIEDMNRKGGLFTDPLANDRPWGGSKRK